jgi:diguanylate cyclase (GGDEF)-like protein
MNLHRNLQNIPENTWKKLFVWYFLFFLTYFLLLSSTFQAILFLLFSLSSAIMIFAGISYYRPYPIAAWILIGVGQLFNLFGDFAYKLEYHFPQSMSYKNIPVIAYILGMVSFLCGMFWLFFQLRKHIHKIHVVYGIVSAVGLVSFLWITLISPHLLAPQFTSNWIEITLFSAGLVTIGVLASIFLLTPLGDTWSYRFLFVVIIINAIALNYYDVKEITTSVQDINSTNWAQILNDATYSLAYLFLGIAFIHPSIKTITRELPEIERQISRQDLIVLGSAFFLPTLALIIKDVNHLNADILVAIGAMLIIFILVEWRLASVVRSLESQNTSLYTQQAKLEYQAFHDTLTGLPNRLNLNKYLSDLRKRRELIYFPVAVFLIDLNKFKQVNDLLGHDKGDRVLKEISEKLSSYSRKGDFMGRWGGDEFLFILENISKENALNFASRLYQEVRIQIHFGKTKFDVDVSIGICMIVEKKIDFSTIIHQADIALYRAKASRKDKIAIFSTGMQDMPSFHGLK